MALEPSNGAPCEIFQTVPAIATNAVTTADPLIAVTDDLSDLLSRHCAVAIGVSGGKDSQACALATFEYLDRIGHRGPRVLVHSDLGMVEWVESLPACEDLARHLGVELMVVRRKAGGLMERWESRWESSVRRYAALSTVTVVLPWSTPALRFCTSELKTHVIASALRRKFPGQNILNVTGIRREESAARARSSVASLDSCSRSGSETWSWRPILDWSTQEVFAGIDDSGMTPHPAYRTWGMSRVSCAFCIMSSAGDLRASSRNPAHQDIYRRMVRLETRSTFGFQGNRWLADVAPHLLSDSERSDVAAAKIRAAARVAVEQRIPRDLLYTKGWPNRMPTPDEAELLASVRRDVSTALRIDAQFLTGQEVLRRYAELMALNKNSGSEADSASALACA